MSRLTKKIRLVLVSSSLVLAGCTRNQNPGPNCQPPPNPDGKQIPPVCGPVQGGRPGAHTGIHHGYGGYYHGWGGSSTSRSPSGRSGFSSGSRGGFGSSSLGVRS